MDYVSKARKTALKRIKRITQNGDETQGDDTRIIFLGNPWVGKSTLLNATIGEVAFSSGSHFIRPVATRVSRYAQGTDIFIDTPGLDHSTDFDKNAEVITNALNEGGKLKIVFVIAVPYGRIQVADVGTMNTFLTALENAGLDPTEKYGIIINQVTPIFKSNLLNNERIQKGTSAALFSRYYNKKIYFVDQDVTLDSKQNALMVSSYAKRLRNFIDSIPAVSIPQEIVLDKQIMEEEKHNAALAIMNFNDTITALVKRFVAIAKKQLT